MCNSALFVNINNYSLFVCHNTNDVLPHYYQMFIRCYMKDVISLHGDSTSTVQYYHHARK